MRFLADENFPGAAVQALRAAGHDVTWVQEAAAGSKDEAVLQRAQDEARILITFDKDFGELAFRRGLPASSGIILLRITAPSAAHVAQVVREAIEQRKDWAGHFSVVDDNRIRMTKLG
jgi:predicted nuclease of predicted toxin-antitoxin system